MNKTIGFFGDSFCAESSNHHSMIHGYETYIKKLEKHYNATTVNLGQGGGSIWDTLLIQLDPFIKSNTIPDICVFIWTTNGRLFHRKIRRINSTEAFNPKLRYMFRPDTWKIWDAAKMYYEYLIDWEKDQLEWEASLRYIDQVVLPKLPTTTKIVHLWTSGKPEGWTKEQIISATYPFKFQRGAEIRPNLTSISLYDCELSILGHDQRCNHLDGEFKNSIVFDWIKTAIDNPDKLWDYTSDVDKLYNKSPATDLPAI